jgi:hypothetical protein
MLAEFSEAKAVHQFRELALQLAHHKVGNENKKRSWARWLPFSPSWQI